MKNLNKSTIIIAISTLIVGIILGWFLFGRNASQDHNHELVREGMKQVWTCSMHPSVRQNESGKCPICGMDLVPLDIDHSNKNSSEIKMSITAMKLANIQTSIISKQKSSKEIRLNGKVQTDEQNVFTQTSHITGRIEKLMVSITGEYIQKGQVIANVYSPELVTAQEELFEAYKIRETQPKLYRAARQKLMNWKLTEEQIDVIIQRGKPNEQFPITSDISGVVTKKSVNLGDHVKQGSALFEIADLSKLWILFDVYESEIPWVKVGDKVTYTLQSIPGKSFSGKIDFIDPVINSRTRVAKARISVRNSNSNLKPEMFVSGTINSAVEKGETAIVIPKSAIMWTGKRSVVYVRTSSDIGIAFIMREVTLGPSLGDSYIIEEGIEVGEEIATNGTFSIDAAAQLAGKPSMMSPTGGAVMTGHNHGASTSAEHSVHNIPAKSIQLSADMEKAISALFESYLRLKDALVKDKFDQTVSEAKKLNDEIDGISMTMFKGEAHNLWIKDGMPLTSLIKEMANASGIEAARKPFKPLSTHMINLAKAFDPLEKPLFIQHCPMADDFKGADWLSTEGNIMNPYYGASMLTCGEVTDTIQ